MTLEQALETLDLLVNDKNCDYVLKIKNDSEYKENYLDIWSYDFDMYVFSEYRKNLIELLEDGIKKLEGVVKLNLNIWMQQKGKKLNFTYRK